MDIFRWVRMAAFQALGPFISTFADSSITKLLHNDNGEIVVKDHESLSARYTPAIVVNGNKDSFYTP